MVLSLMSTSSILIVSFVLLIVLSVAPYYMAKSKYDYNIYNLGNVGVIFGGMVMLFILLILSEGTDDIFIFLLSVAVIVVVISTIVFVRTYRNTNFLIALLAIIPQIMITIIIYIIMKMIYNKMLKSEY